MERMEFDEDVIKATMYAVNCDGDQALLILEETERQKRIAVRDIIPQLVMEATKLLALFNTNKLTSLDLREHRQYMKDLSDGFQGDLE